LPEIKYPYGKISYLYSVGRIKALEGTLLSRSDWNMLIESKNQDATLKLLIDMGYGKNKEGITYGELIDSELEKVYEIIKNLSPDKDLTGLFFYEIDAHNLKVFLKSKIINQDPLRLLKSSGNFDKELLRICVDVEDYSLMGEFFEKKLIGVNDIKEPNLLSAAVDKVFFEYIFYILEKKNNRLLKNYFTKYALYINRNIKLRSNLLGFSEKQIKKLLIDVDESISINGDTGVIEAEREMNKELLKTLRDEKGDSFGIGPVICFLMDKRNEAMNLRVLFALKQSEIKTDIDWFDL
jgi:V/A-type H+-transporting ATPase subunit C